MTTYKTLSDARQGGQAIDGIRSIVEIDHASEGRCFIAVKASMATLANALKAKPIAEIKKLVAEHTLYTPEQIAATVSQHLAEHCNCERCNAKIDGNAAYRQKEWYRGTKVIAFYCEPCRQLLQAIGAGEFTAMQERAAERGSREEYTKADY